MSTNAPRNEWKTIPLRYVCQLNPPVKFEEFDDDDDLTFLPMDRVKSGYFIPNTDKFSKLVSSYTTFEEGDIVVAKVTPCFENGNIAIAENLVGGKGFGSSELFVIRPTRVDRRFLFYYFQSSSFKQEGEASMTGAGGLKRVSPDLLRQHYLPCPDELTQRRIANYLDRETERIDTLVAEKERMLALLEEERRSLVHIAIEHRLTKTMRIQHAARIVSRPIPRLDDETYVPVGIFNRGRGIFHKEPTAGSDLGDSDFYFLKADDLIVSGQFAWEGAVAVAEHSEEGCVASHRYHVFRGKEGVLNTTYFWAYLTTQIGDLILNDHSRGAAGRNRPLNPNTFVKEKIPIPPLELQIDIAEHVRRERKLKSVIDESKKLLDEHRQALITAAVTGQIPLAEMVA